MDRIILKLSLAVIILPELPPEIMLNWIESMKKSIPRIEKNLKKAIKSFEDFMEKMVNPGLNVLKDFIDPKFVSKGGLNIDRIIKNVRDNAPKSYQKYKQKIDKLFKTVDGVHAREYIARIMHGATRYAEKMRLRVIPFIGYKKQVRGVARLAPRFFTGDKKAINKLIKADKLKQSNPVDIIRPASRPLGEARPSAAPSGGLGMISKFRQKCFYRLRRAGSEIMRDPTDQLTQDAENDLTNQLMNEFIRPDIVPFITGGNSHIDFILVGNQLYLDIQVTIK